MVSETATSTTDVGRQSDLALRNGFLFLNALRIAGQRINATDLLLFVYFSVFVRQYFWTVKDEGLAWGATVVVTAIGVGLHIFHREQEPLGLTPQFWLIVALPLFAMFSFRAAFPDFSFDVLNYHIVNAERGLRGYSGLAGDFFPSILPVNPAADMASGIFRYALGYRLGTVINLFAILWAAAIIDRVLRLYVASSWLRSVCVLVVSLAEWVPYLLNLYNVDVLAVPLLLESTYMVWRFNKIGHKNYALVHTALFLGMSTAFKLSNLAFAIPILLLCVYQVFTYRSEIKLKYIVLAIAACFAPLFPFTYYIFRDTGNPMFPYFNAIFKSPFAPARNLKDLRRGPMNFWQALVWPIRGVSDPFRIDALGANDDTGDYYTGRLSIGFVVSAIGLACRFFKREVRVLCFLAFLGCLLWSLSSGDVRYAVYLESLCTLTVIICVASIYGVTVQKEGVDARRFTLLPVVIGVILIVQTVACYRTNYSYHENLYGLQIQPSVFQDYGAYAHEARQIFRDRNLDSYLPDEQKNQLKDVDVWINSYGACSGVETLLKNNVPIVTVSNFVDLLDYLETKSSRERLAAALASLRGKRMYALAYPPRLYLSLGFIKRTGLRIGKTIPFQVPYYSDRIKINMVLIEILPSEDASGSLTK